MAKHSGLEACALDRPPLSDLFIVFLMFDGAIKLVPWPVVTETMDRMGYGSSETLPRPRNYFHRLHRALSDPADLVPWRDHHAAISAARWPRMSRIGSPLFTHTLFGLYLGLLLWGGLWLRDRRLRELIPFRR